MRRLVLGDPLHYCGVLVRYSSHGPVRRRSPAQPSPAQVRRPGFLAARIFGSHWVGNPRVLPMRARAGAPACVPNVRRTHAPVRHAVRSLSDDVTAHPSKRHPTAQFSCSRTHARSLARLLTHRLAIHAQRDRPLCPTRILPSGLLRPGHPAEAVAIRSPCPSCRTQVAAVLPVQRSRRSRLVRIG